MQPKDVVNALGNRTGVDSVLKHLDECVVIVGAHPPEGERFCVVSRDDMLRPFGIQSWTLLTEAALRDQLQVAGLPADRVEAKLAYARQRMSTLICGTS